MSKAGGDPLTSADLELDRILRLTLLRDGEGWLSEETADDPNRLDKDLVWIVDPLDGTREFIDGLPEFCTSIAAVVDGWPVAGGIVNPEADLKIVGGPGFGVVCNGRVAGPGSAKPQHSVLASRSEWKRGTWSVVEDAGWEVIPMGSVAYKLARVAAGLDAATWTPVPKHEWDVAAGSALLAGIGGALLSIEDWMPVRFNRERPWLPGAVAMTPPLRGEESAIHSLIRQQRRE